MADQNSLSAASRTHAGSHPETLGEMEPIGDRHIRVDQAQGYHSYPPHLRAKYLQYVTWLTAHLETRRPIASISSQRVDSRHTALDMPHYDTLQPETGAIQSKPMSATTTEVPNKEIRQINMARPVSEAKVSRPVPPAVYPPANNQQVPITVSAWSLPDFRWPNLINEIVERPIKELPAFAKSLISSANRYLRPTSQRIGIVGAGRNQGTSFISMLIARGLQSIGKRVLLVDGDVTSPGLTATLGLTSKVSWHGLMRMPGPTSEAIVQSERTGVSLMPLSNSLAHLKQPERLLDGLSNIVDPIRTHFDAIVIDLGPAVQLFEELGASNSLVDSAVLVQNVQKANHQKYNQIRNDLRKFGISKLIVAQNFVQTPTDH